MILSDGTEFLTDYFEANRTTGEIGCAILFFNKDITTLLKILPKVEDIDIIIEKLTDLRTRVTDLNGLI